MNEIDLGTKINIFPEEDIKNVIKNVFESLSDVKESYLANIRENKEKFKRFISPGKSLFEEFSFLSVLRKWNSYTPVLSAKGGHARGGGYFIFHNGIGVVIDPGYNFVQNFFEQGFKLDDIDVVVITHAHNDHTIELESIFSLLFKRNKEVAPEQCKKIDLYLNLGTFKKFSGLFDLSHNDYPNYINNIILLDSHNEYRIPKEKMDPDIRLLTTKTQHHEMITCSYALGFVIQCGERIIRFTGDTGWNEKIEKENDEFMECKQIDKIDILISHLGSIEEKEFNFDFSKTIAENIEGEIFYKHHLGILGSICMMHKHRPDLVIFSEFGEELKSIRKGLVERISNAMTIPAIPGDIGLHLKLDDMTVFCSKTGKFEPLNKIEVHQVDDDIYYISKDFFTIGDRVDEASKIKNSPNVSFRSERV